MKTHKYTTLIAFFILALVFTNCERNILVLPDGSSNNPVFRLEMDLDNSPISIIAGENDIYNHTAFTADSDEVLSFHGSLAKADCSSSCAGSFNLKLRNFEVGVSKFDVSRSISAKSYPYKYSAAPTTDAIELHMDISTQASKPQITWNLNNRSITQQSLSDVHVINLVDEREVFAALNIVDEATGLRSFVDKEIELDSDITGVSSRIALRQIEGDSVEFSIIHTLSDGFEPLAATLWAIEDLDGRNPKLITDQTGKITLRIGEGKSISNATSFLSDNDGTRTGAGVEVKYDPVRGLIYHDANFDYLVEKIITGGSDLALQSFEFNFIDENGISFSSAKGEQNDISTFDIIQVEPYLDDAEGQKTVKLTCSFSCRIYDDTGSFKQVNNAIATIAVAIP